MTCDWPSTTESVGQPGVERQRRRRDRHDLAADGQDPVHLADALLEVAVLDRGHRGDQQVPEGVTGQATGRRPRPLGESVLEQLAHQRLGVGQGDDAVADVADRRDAELVRSTPDEPPSSATVTIAVRLLVCSLRPRSSVDRPVPPPIATIRGPRARKRFW